MITKKIAITDEAREEIYYKEGVLLPKEINLYFDPQTLTEENRRFLGHPEYNVPLVTEFGRYAPKIHPQTLADTKTPLTILYLLKKYCDDCDEQVKKELADAARKYLAGGEYWYNKFEKYYPECVAERDRRAAEKAAADEAHRQRKAAQEAQAAAEFTEFLQKFASADTKAQIENGYITRTDCIEEIETYICVKTGYHATPTGNVEKFTRPTAAQIQTSKNEDAVIYIDEEEKLYLNKYFTFAGFKFDLYKDL